MAKEIIVKVPDFPKVLYRSSMDGVEEVKVLEANYIGRRGLEIVLAGGECIYECLGRSRKLYNMQRFGDYYDIDRCYFKDRDWAEDRIAREKEQREYTDFKDKIYYAYRNAQRAGGILTFDFSNKK